MEEILPIRLLCSNTTIQWRLEAAARSVVGLEGKKLLLTCSSCSKQLCPTSEASLRPSSNLSLGVILAKSLNHPVLGLTTPLAGLAVWPW